MKPGEAYSAAPARSGRAPPGPHCEPPRSARPLPRGSEEHLRSAPHGRVAEPRGRSSLHHRGCISADSLGFLTGRRSRLDVQRDAAGRVRGLQEAWLTGALLPRDRARPGRAPRVQGSVAREGRGVSSGRARFRRSRTTVRRDRARAMAPHTSPRSRTIPTVTTSRPSSMASADAIRAVHVMRKLRWAALRRPRAPPSGRTPERFTISWPRAELPPGPAPPGGVALPVATSSPDG